MHRAFTGGLLSAAAGLLLAGAAAAQPFVQQTGNTYHVNVCPQTVGLYAQCHAHVVTDSAGHLQAHSLPPIGGLQPAQLRDAYKVKTDGDSKTIIAIVDAFGYDNAEKDLGIYRTQWGLPDCTTGNYCFKKLNENGKAKNYPAFNLGWAQESALDVDMASAMCPKCKIYLIEANNNSFKHLAIAVDEAAKLGAHVISNSYGGNESKRVADFAAHYDHPGIAITASTGDSGYGVQAPADMPTVIAVGGTALHVDSNKRGWSETVWSGAGSGCSHVFTKAAWQTDKGCKGRSVGDVAAVASPSTGVAVYGPVSQTLSSWLVFGGTSVAAPLVGGIFGNKAGTVNAAGSVYEHQTSLFDVTTGTNGTCHHAYLCTGEVGYDGPTGMGTPDGTDAFGD